MTNRALIISKFSGTFRAYECRAQMRIQSRVFSPNCGVMTLRILGLFIFFDPEEVGLMLIILQVMGKSQNFEFSFFF